MKRLLAAAAIVVALSACGADSSPADLETPDPDGINMGAGYGSVSFVCHGSVGVYVTRDDVRSSSAIAVIGAHPECVPS